MTDATAQEATTPVLREKGLLTRLMILRALTRDATRPLRQVADEVGVTAQAVSDQLKRLAADGHVVQAGDVPGPRITPDGLAFLESQMRRIKDYVDGTLREVSHVERCGAVAGAPIEAGDKVGLFMEDGALVAWPDRRSSSTGRATMAAATGQDLAVADLEGIVDLEPGRTWLGILPDATAGGSRAVDGPRLDALLTGAAVVVTQGPVAMHLAEAHQRIPVRFGGAFAAADAALRGLDTVLLVEAWESTDALARFEDARRMWGLPASPETVRLGR